MADVKVQVNLLLDTLSRKQLLLEEILGYTKDQTVILDKEDMDLKGFNNLMQNKQVRIDQLVQIDNGFEQSFARIKSTLSTQPELYREDILLMKERITSINDLGVNIQVTEMRNKTKFDLKSQNIKNEAKSFRTHKSAVSNYQNNYNKSNKTDQPHFFDSKK